MDPVGTNPISSANNNALPPPVIATQRKGKEKIGEDEEDDEQKEKRIQTEIIKKEEQIEAAKRREVELRKLLNDKVETEKNTDDCITEGAKQEEESETKKSVEEFDKLLNTLDELSLKKSYHPSVASLKACLDRHITD